MIDMIDPWDDRPIGKLAIVAGLVVVAGCATTRSDVAGPTITAQEIQDLRTETTGLHATVAELRKDITVGGNMNEPWTARLLAAVLGAMGLYLVKYRVRAAGRMFDWMQGKGMTCFRQAPTPPPGGG